MKRKMHSLLTHVFLLPGTEAAAATAVEVNSRMATIPPSFTIDMPFFFAIYDTRASIYTFIGKVDDPQL